MQCPIAENVLLDFLEGELTGQPAAEVAEHLASCEGCSAAFGRLRSVRWALRDKVASYQPPDQDFWRDNLEAVGMATWRSGKPGRKSGLGRLNRMAPVLAAAAVILLAIVGSFKLNTDPQDPDRRFAAGASDSITTEALVDSLYMLAELARQYELTYSTIESIEQLATGAEGESYSETGMTYPVTGNVYDALLDMDDDQLDQVLMVLASN